MTKLQARHLILVLCAKCIAFKLRREGNTYVIAFDMKHAMVVKEAIGD